MQGNTIANSLDVVNAAINIPELEYSHQSDLAAQHGYLVDKVSEYQKYQLSPAGASFLVSLGIPVNKTAAGNHGHPVSKTLAMYTLLFEIPPLITQDCTFIQLKEYKYKQLIKKISTPGLSHSLTNYVLSHADTRRFPDCRMLPMRPITTPFCFLDETLHYLSPADVLHVFDQSPALNVMFATVLIPPELLLGVRANATPLYSYYIEGSELIYSPDGQVSESYRQPLACTWLLECALLRHETTTISISHVRQSGSLHILQLMRGVPAASLASSIVIPNQILLPGTYHDTAQLVNAPAYLETLGTVISLKNPTRPGIRAKVRRFALEHPSLMMQPGDILGIADHVEFVARRLEDLDDRYSSLWSPTRWVMNCFVMRSLRFRWNPATITSRTQITRLLNSPHTPLTAHYLAINTTARSPRTIMTGGPSTWKTINHVSASVASALNPGDAARHAQVPITAMMGMSCLSGGSITESLLRKIIPFSLVFLLNLLFAHSWRTFLTNKLIDYSWQFISSYPSRVARQPNWLFVIPFLMALFGNSVELYARILDVHDRLMVILTQHVRYFWYSQCLNRGGVFQSTHTIMHFCFGPNEPELPTTGWGYSISEDSSEDGVPPNIAPSNPSPPASDSSSSSAEIDDASSDSASIQSEDCQVYANKKPGALSKFTTDVLNETPRNTAVLSHEEIKEAPVTSRPNKLGPLSARLAARSEPEQTLAPAMPKISRWVTQRPYPTVITRLQRAGASPEITAELTAVGDLALEEMHPSAALLPASHSLPESVRHALAVVTATPVLEPSNGIRPDFPPSRKHHHGSNNYYAAPLDHANYPPNSNWARHTSRASIFRLLVVNQLGEDLQAVSGAVAGFEMEGVDLDVADLSTVAAIAERLVHLFPIIFCDTKGSLNLWVDGTLYLIGNAKVGGPAMAFKTGDNSFLYAANPRLLHGTCVSTKLPDANTLHAEWSETPVPGDGDCGYHALNMALAANHHPQLRKALAMDLVECFNSDHDNIPLEPLSGWLQYEALVILARGLALPSFISYSNIDSITYTPNTNNEPHELIQLSDNHYHYHSFVPPIESVKARAAIDPLPKLPCLASAMARELNVNGHELLAEWKEAKVLPATAESAPSTPFGIKTIERIAEKFQYSVTIQSPSGTITMGPGDGKLVDLKWADSHWTAGTGPSLDTPFHEQFCKIVRGYVRNFNPQIAPAKAFVRAMKHDAYGALSRIPKYQSNITNWSGMLDSKPRTRGVKLGGLLGEGGTGKSHPFRHVIASAVARGKSLSGLTVVFPTNELRADFKRSIGYDGHHNFLKTWELALHEPVGNTVLFDDFSLTPPMIDLFIIIHPNVRYIFYTGDTSQTECQVGQIPSLGVHHPSNLARCKIAAATYLTKQRRLARAVATKLGCDGGHDGKGDISFRNTFPKKSVIVTFDAHSITGLAACHTAFTVQAAQGQSFDHVVLHVNRGARMATDDLWTVALTRSRGQLEIMLETQTAALLKTSPSLICRAILHLKETGDYVPLASAFRAHVDRNKPKHLRDPLLRPNLTEEVPLSLLGYGLGNQALGDHIKAITAGKIAQFKPIATNTPPMPHIGLRSLNPDTQIKRDTMISTIEELDEFLAHPVPQDEEPTLDEESIAVAPKIPYTLNSDLLAYSPREIIECESTRDELVEAIFPNCRMFGREVLRKDGLTDQISTTSLAASIFPIHHNRDNVTHRWNFEARFVGPQKHAARFNGGAYALTHHFIMVALGGSMPAWNQAAYEQCVEEAMETFYSKGPKYHANNVGKVDANAPLFNYQTFHKAQSVTKVSAQFANAKKGQMITGCQTQWNLMQSGLAKYVTHTILACLPGNIIFNTELTPEELSAKIRHSTSHALPDSTWWNNDYTSWDSQQNECYLGFWQILLTSMGTPEPLVEMFSSILLHTKLGNLTVGHMLPSGFPFTWALNTIGNCATMATKLQLPNLHANPHITMLVSGDDACILLPPTMFSRNDEPKVRTWFHKYRHLISAEGTGNRSKIAEFCSQLFVGGELLAEPVNHLARVLYRLGKGDLTSCVLSYSEQAARLHHCYSEAQHDLSPIQQSAHALTIGILRHQLRAQGLKLAASYMLKDIQHTFSLGEESDETWSADLPSGLRLKRLFNLWAQRKVTDVTFLSAETQDE